MIVKHIQSLAIASDAELLLAEALTRVYGQEPQPSLAAFHRPYVEGLVRIWGSGESPADITELALHITAEVYADRKMDDLSLRQAAALQEMFLSTCVDLLYLNNLH